MNKLYVIYVADAYSKNSYLEIDFTDSHEKKSSEKILGEFDTPKQCAEIFDENGFYSERDIGAEVAEELINELYLPF